MLEEEGLHYQCSENEGADQLLSYAAGDLRLFSHMQKVGFLMKRLICCQYLFLLTETKRDDIRTRNKCKTKS